MSVPDRSQPELQGLFLREAYELAGVGTYVIYPESGTIHMSAEMVHLLRAGDGPLTLPMNEYRDRFYHPDERSTGARADTAYAEGSPFQLQARVVRGDGQNIWVRASSRSSRDAKEQPIVVGVMQDVTEMRLAMDESVAQGALARESEARFRTLIERAPLAIGISRAGAAVFVNPKFVEAWGYRSAQEALGRPIGENWAPEARDAIVEGARRRSAGLPSPAEFEGLALRRDRSTFWAHAHVVSIDLADGPASMAFFSDVTQSKRDQDALRESEQRFREIAETIGEVFWIVDPIQRRTLYVSPAYEKVWGRPHGEAYRSADAFLAAVHPDDRDRVQEAVMTKTASGDYHEVYRIVRPNGAVRWIRDRAFPVKDASGDVRRVIGVATDITEQRDLEAQLLHAQKMEAIGALAGGVAHDFNNILSVILNQARTIRERVGADEALAEPVAEVEKAARRGASLTQELLAFGSKQVFEPQVLALDRVVAAAESLLLRVVGRDVELRVVPYHGELRVRVDPRQVEQVLMNLAVNARDAMPEGGKLTVELGRTEVRASEAARMDLKPGPHAILSVIDSGVGMDAATKARIFEPFFTTKEMGQGTGLGLAAVFGIVRQSSGHIAVASSPGKGTAFRIFLPLTTAKLASPSGPPPAHEHGGGQTVLVVDDDDSVRKVVCGILLQSGYVVLEAKSGGDAILVCEQHKGPLDVVVTDVIMPLIRGDQLAARILKMRPTLGIVYLSGYPRSAGDGALSPPGEFVAKPFEAEGVLRAVGRAVAHARSAPPS